MMMEIKFSDIPKFIKYLFVNRADLYEQFKIQDKTDLVGATVALLNREENKVSAFSPNTFFNTKKIPEESLNPYRYAGTIDTRKTLDGVDETSPLIPLVVAAAVIAASSDTASASTSDSSDTFSAGGGDFSGGGSDASY
jgi:uncharacterized membrane protein YgcG